MHPIYKIILSCFIILIAFKFETKKTFLKDLLAFYLVTFLNGGIMFGIHYFFQFDSNALGAFLALQTNSFGDPISWLFVLIGFPVAYYFSKQQIDSHETTKIYYDQLVDCMVCIDNEVFQFTALIDSGNHAQDVISSKPIHFLSFSMFKEKLPSYELITSKGKDITLTEQTSEFLKNKKFTIVPYQVLGSKTNLIIAFMPDWMVIKNKEEVVTLENSYISLVDQQFSTENKFFGILNPKCFQFTKANKKII